MKDAAKRVYFLVAQAIQEGFEELTAEQEADRREIDARVEERLKQAAVQQQQTTEAAS